MYTHTYSFKYFLRFWNIPNVHARGVFFHFCPTSHLPLSFPHIHSLHDCISRWVFHDPLKNVACSVWKAKVCVKFGKEGGKGEGDRVLQPSCVASRPAATTLKQDGDRLWFFFTLQLNTGFVWGPSLLFLISLNPRSVLLLLTPSRLVGNAGPAPPPFALFNNTWYC